MTRDTTHGTKGSSIVRAIVAAVLVASMFGLSTLGASAQEAPTGFDPGEFEAPSPLEFCQEQYPEDCRHRTHRRGGAGRSRPASRRR